MTDYISSNSMLMLERAMNFQWTKQETLLDNIVNADTPGYKAKYVTFEEAMPEPMMFTLPRKAIVSSCLRRSASRPPPRLLTANGHEEPLHVAVEGVVYVLDLIGIAHQLQLLLGLSNAGYNRTAGVKVAGIIEDDSDFKLKYDPTDPDATCWI